MTRVTRADTALVSSPAGLHWIQLFDDRYGVGSYEQLLRQLKTPCTSFAAIAAAFGVTRERVRQWHLQLMPEAPKGHQRRRLCLRSQQRREVLSDPMFRAFYRQARNHFAPQQFGLIATRERYCRRFVRLDGWLVAIKSARSLPEVRREGASTYLLPARGRTVDFVYFQLTDESFLFLPGGVLPRCGTTFIESHRSKYWPFFNSFAAVSTGGEAVDGVDAGRE